MSSEAVSSVLNIALQQDPNAQAGLKSQNGGAKRSFEEVLQNGSGQQTEATNQTNVAPVDAAKSAKIEQLQSELIQNYDQINAVQPPTSTKDILPDLFYNKTRVGLLREAVAGMNKMPEGSNIVDRFQQIEGEHNQIEAIMKSNKDLSPGELLGLQARMYQVSQHIEVMSKVVDQVTGGIKTILNTNV
jgi:hypothetical protein